MSNDTAIPLLVSENPQIIVGDYTYGDPKLLVWLPDDKIVIGKYCSIAEDVVIMGGGEHRSDWATTYPLRIVFGLENKSVDGHPSSKGPTVIGNDVWIGFGATILSGVTIGDGAIIGARSVVSKDVAPYSIVAGNPAYEIRKRFDDSVIKQLLELNWWDWPTERILENVDKLCDDPRKLLNKYPDQSIANAVSFHPPHLQLQQAIMAPAWLGHIPFMRWLIAKHQPRLFVELGSHHGNSFFATCEAVSEEGLSCMCHAIDTWEGDEHAGSYDDAVYRDFKEYCTSNYKDIAIIHRMRFDQAIEKFDDGSIDLLHIDGLHTYEASKTDYETWLRKMAPRSIILFHDTQERGSDFGVWKIWEEITASNPCHFELTHSHGLGVLGIGFDNELEFPFPTLNSDKEGLENIVNLFGLVGDRLSANVLHAGRTQKNWIDSQQEVDQLKEVLNSNDKPTEN